MKRTSEISFEQYLKEKVQRTDNARLVSRFFLVILLIFSIVMSLAIFCDPLFSKYTTTDKIIIATIGAVIVSACFIYYRLITKKHQRMAKSLQEYLNKKARRTV